MDTATTNTADTRQAQVLVDDGQTLWAADVAELAAAMAKNGWNDDRASVYGGRIYVEPTANDFGDHGAYSELCEDVQPVAGEGAERDLTEEEIDSLPRMTFAPDQQGWDVPAELARAIQGAA